MEIHVHDLNCAPRSSTAANFLAGFHYTGWKGITPQLQVNFRVAGKDSGVPPTQTIAAASCSTLRPAASSA